MVFISNSGKTKIVKTIVSKLFITIPSGFSPHFDDPIFESVVKNNSDLKFISEEIFKKAFNKAKEEKVKNDASVEKKYKKSAKIKNTEQLNDNSLDQ